MGMPKAVAEKEEAANKAILQNAEAAGAAIPEPEAPAEQSVQDPAVEPAIVAPQPAEPNHKELYEKLVAEVGSQPYKVLQGKYNAEVPRMAAEIRELKQKIRGLEEAAAAPEARDPEVAGPTIEKLREDYGTEFVDGIMSAVREEISRERDGIMQRIAPVVERVQKSGYDEYLDRVTELVPEWRDVVNTSGFQAFMSEVEPMSGMTRIELARMADEDQDPIRMASFYEAYRIKSGSQRPRDVEAEVPDDPRESLVAPRGTRGGEAPPERVAAELIKSSELSRFYLDAAKGYYKSRPEEYRKLEAKYNLAIQQGRVVQG